VQFLKRFLPNAKDQREHDVVLYGKDGCHLCDEAKEMLETLQKHGNFRVREVDITSDPALFRRYEVRIPVIIIDNLVELEAPIHHADLQRALR